MIQMMSFSSLQKDHPDPGASIPFSCHYQLMSWTVIVIVILLRPLVTKATDLILEKRDEA